MWSRKVERKRYGVVIIFWEKSLTIQERFFMIFPLKKYNGF